MHTMERLLHCIIQHISTTSNNTTIDPTYAILCQNRTTKDQRTNLHPITNNTANTNAVVVKVPITPGGSVTAVWPCLKTAGPAKKASRRGDYIHESANNYQLIRTTYDAGERVDRRPSRVENDKLDKRSYTSTRHQELEDITQELIRASLIRMTRPSCWQCVESCHTQNASTISVVGRNKFCQTWAL
jgi:hypothetical protein